MPPRYVDVPPLPLGLRYADIFSHCYADYAIRCQVARRRAIQLLMLCRHADG